jgi:RNA polymerase sigma-70 factor (ECF subfamily)
VAFSTPPELIEPARSGDPEAAERLIEAVWPDAVRLATAIVGDSAAGEDAAQEACIALYRRIQTLRHAQAFHFWFYRIVVREASAVKRRRARAEQEPAADIVTCDSSDSIDVWRALALLPAGLRRVVVLHYFEDLSSSEIGSILRIPAPTVRFQLALARRRLRPLLDDSRSSTIDAKEVRTHAV